MFVGLNLKLKWKLVFVMLDVEVDVGKSLFIVLKFVWEV